MSTKQVRSFCFTLNNYVADEIQAVRDYSANCKYMVFGYEKGEQGTIHLQGYCQLKKVTAFNKIKKTFPRMHIEETKGTPQQAADYCKKDGLIEEFGELSTSGRGGDIEKERYARNLELAKAGNLEELSQVDPEAYTRCYKTYHAVATETRIKSNDCSGFEFVCKRPWALFEYTRRLSLPINREADPSIIWIYGPPATGKTYVVRNQHYDNGDLIPVFDIPESKDFAEYKGEIILAVNEFQGCFTPTQLIKWTEETRVNGKYLPAFQLPKNVVLMITSNGSPDEVYHNYAVENPVHFQAFKTRCLILQLSEPNPNVRREAIVVDVDHPDEVMKEVSPTTRNPFSYLKNLPSHLTTKS